MKLGRVGVEVSGIMLDTCSHWIFEGRLDGWIRSTQNHLNAWVLVDHLVLLRLLQDDALGNKTPLKTYLSTTGSN